MNKLSALALIAALGAGAPLAAAHAQDVNAGVEAGAGDAGVEVDAGVDAGADGVDAGVDVDAGAGGVDAGVDAGAEVAPGADEAAASASEYTTADLQTAMETEVDLSGLNADTEIVVVGTADLAEETEVRAESEMSTERDPESETAAEGAPVAEGDMSAGADLNADVLAEAGANEDIAAAINAQDFGDEHDIVALWWENDTTLVVFVDTMQ